MGFHPIPEKLSIAQKLREALLRKQVLKMIQQKALDTDAELDIQHPRPSFSDLGLPSSSVTVTFILKCKLLKCNKAPDKVGQTPIWPWSTAKRVYARFAVTVKIVKTWSGQVQSEVFVKYQNEWTKHESEGSKGATMEVEPDKVECEASNPMPRIEASDLCLPIPHRATLKWASYQQALHHLRHQALQEDLTERQGDASKSVWRWQQQWALQGLVIAKPYFAKLLGVRNTKEQTVASPGLKL